MKNNYRIDQTTIKELASNLKDSVVELTRCGQRLSPQATMVGLGLQLAGLKRRLASPSQRQALLTAAQTEEFGRPLNLKLKSNYGIKDLAGRRGAIINDQGPTQPLILYLYGGGFVMAPTKVHWQFWDRLAQATGAKIVIPDYPHLPEANLEQALDYLHQLYAKLYDLVPVSQVTLMGDSAGGHLATCLAEELERAGLPVPGHLVLISPWLDLGLTNPALDQYDRSEVLLDRGGLQKLGARFAGKIAPDDFRFRPLNGPVDGLRDVRLIVGTKELMCLDTIEFANRLVQANVPTKLTIGRGLYHSYPLYATPEGNAVVKQLSQAVKGAK